MLKKIYSDSFLRVVIDLL